MPTADTLERFNGRVGQNALPGGGASAGRTGAQLPDALALKAHPAINLRTFPSHRCL